MVSNAFLVHMGVFVVAGHHITILFINMTILKGKISYIIYLLHTLHIICEMH